MLGARRSTTLVLVVACLVVAACGSTDQQSAQLGSVANGSSAGATTGLSSGGTSGLSSVPAQTVGSGTGAPVVTTPGEAGVGGVSTTGLTQGSVAQVTPGRPGEIPGDGPGVTATQIAIGINLPSPSSGSAVAQTFGAKGIEVGDNAPEVRSIVAYINAHGGVAGRTLVPVIAYTDITQGDYDTEAQSACNAFTSDHKVFAVIQLVNDQSPVLPQCLAAHGVLLFDDGNSIFYDHSTIATQFGPGYYSPDRLTLDRFGDVINGLAQQGYFTKGAKVGVILFDLPSYTDAMTQVIKPALAALGADLVDTFVFGAVTSTEGIGGAAAQAADGVLKFRSEGIDHVLFVDSEGALPFLWMPVAQTQNYHPRYGLSSGDLPFFMQQNAPAAQLAGAVAVGYSRAVDVLDQSYNDTPQMRECMAALQVAQVTSPDIAYTIGCDPFFLLQAAGNHASILSVAGIRAAVDGLGTSLQLAGPPLTRFGPGIIDGIGAYRDLSYESSCGCFRYTSGPLPMP